MTEDQDGPRRKVTHQLGQTLDDLSVADFDERIALLEAEIARLDSARRLKRQALDDAGSVFKSASPKA